MWREKTKQKTKPVKDKTWTQWGANAQNKGKWFHLLMVVCVCVCLVQLTMWSLNLVPASSRPLSSGTNGLTASPAVTTHCTWTSLSGTKASRRRWRRSSRTTVRGLHTLSSTLSLSYLILRQSKIRYESGMTCKVPWENVVIWLKAKKTNKKTTFNWD